MAGPMWRFGDEKLCKYCRRTLRTQSERDYGICASCLQEQDEDKPGGMDNDGTGEFSTSKSDDDSGNQS